MNTLKRLLRLIGPVLGIIWFIIYFFASGVVIFPIFTAMLILRGFGYWLLADRMGNWIWNRSTRFHF